MNARSFAKKVGTVGIGGLVLGLSWCGTTSNSGSSSGSSGSASGSGSSSGGAGSGTVAASGMSSSSSGGASSGSSGSSRSGSGASSGTSGASGAVATSGSVAGSGSSGGGDAAASGAPDAGTSSVDLSAAVLERNKHPTRDGHFVQPTLMRSQVGTMALDTTFNASFNGAMWASPLYSDKGPGGKGIFIAVTTGNDVYALDETTGMVTWHVNVGSSPTMNGVACGNIHPLGILSTPVIDPTPGADGFGTLYVAGAIGTNSIDHHAAFALSLKDGSLRAGWPVNVSALQATTATAAGVNDFHPAASNQRSALSLVGGILYIAYGGHVGDCDTYHGWVVAINTADPTKTGAWMTAGQGQAIWAAGGMASDGNGVIAVTGNSTAGLDPHTDSELVVRLTGMATLSRSSATTFYPTGGNTLWRLLDQDDRDFGANSPVVVPVAGNNYVAAVTKNGELFVLNASNFGGTDPGNLIPPGGSYLKVAADGMSIHTALAAYNSVMTGTHVILTASAPMCPSSNPGTAVMSIALSQKSPPVPTVAWCAGSGSQTAPIATTIDGTGDSIVWYVDGGTLVGVNGDTGMSLVRAQGNCANVRQWTSPIAVKGRIIAGGDGHLCAWAVK
jgi:hypothetical protein